LRPQNYSKRLAISDENHDESIILPESIYEVIHFVRGRQVLLDQDLAELYGVETRRLNEQVKRNEDRFPDDFMFQLTEKEWDNLMSQIVTSSVHGGRRKLPYAFTQEGVAMLSSVLNSDRAIQVNIEIMRIFVRFRRLLANQEELASKLKELETHFEGRLAKQDNNLRMLFEAIRRVSDEIHQPSPPATKKKRQIGFHTEEDENKTKASTKSKASKSAKKRGKS
jgi:ORF6N domain